MKGAIIVLSRPGLQVARKIRPIFPGASLFLHHRLEDEERDAEIFQGDLKTFLGTLFYSFDFFILVMAAGIAVRVISPYLENKKVDPAVVIVDDRGTFAVSLLSGHYGGANDLAERIAAGIGALPVITTSTDRHGLLAFDLLARRMGWKIEHEEDLKHISALQVEGKKIVVITDQNITVAISEISRRWMRANTKKIPLMGAFSVISLQDRAANSRAERDAGGLVFISSRENLSRRPGKPFIILRPRRIWAGIGCRRGVQGAKIIKAVQETFRRSGHSIASLQGLATIDMKSDERGLLEAAEHFCVPLKFWQAGELRGVEHLFSASPFVKEKTGCGSVAEPSAFLGSKQGTMLSGRCLFPGITVALGERHLSFKWASSK